MKKMPDKTITQTYAGRRYSVHLFAKEDAAYIYDEQYADEPTFKFGPINNISLIEIANKARKAARYLSGLERDFKKLKEQGFEFLVAPKPIPALKKAVQKEAPIPEAFLPKWRK